MQILNAIVRRDYYLVQGLVALLSSFFIIVNMAIDIGYIYLDPHQKGTGWSMMSERIKKY